MVKKIIIANWKMNPSSQKDAEKILAGYEKNFSFEVKKIKNSEIIICPPYVYLSSLFNLLKSKNYKLKSSFGAQNIFWEKEGAYTGEISANMLVDSGCEYVVIGHSERRKHLGETDEMINKKVANAIKSGLKVILCVGEHHRENMQEIPKIVEDQVAAALNGLPKSAIDNLIVAYEPVWAIGSGTPDTPEGAMMAAVLIRKTAVNIFGQNAKNLKVVYGGSVNSTNAASFINHEGIDGVLVGGASLNPEEFIKIAANS